MPSVCERLAAPAAEVRHAWGVGGLGIEFYCGSHASSHGCGRMCGRERFVLRMPTHAMRLHEWQSTISDLDQECPLRMFPVRPAALLQYGIEIYFVGFKRANQFAELLSSQNLFCFCSF